MPWLLASAKNNKKSLLSKTTKGKLIKPWKALSKTVTYKWLNRLSFYTTKEKKKVYVNSYKRANVIDYRQNEFLPKIALY
jgi:hypothetical protein